MKEKLYRQEDGKILPVTRGSFETEAKLQKLIADTPELLLRELYSSKEIEDGRQIFLIGREVGVRKSREDTESLWLDVLFVDDTGLPILVEVKRAVNQEIHRLVIAQLIEYATFAHNWQKDMLRDGFLQNNSEEVRGKYDTDSFWDAVLTHLEEETYTIVVAADEIKGELAKMLGFLDNKMPDITVCGIEINYYDDLYATRFIGNRIAQAKKAARTSKNWNASTLLAKCNEIRPELSAASERIIQFAEHCGLPVHYGHGMIYASVDVSIDGAWLYQLQTLDRDIAIYVSYANLSKKLHGKISAEEILDVFKPLARPGSSLLYSRWFIKLRVSELATEEKLSCFFEQCNKLIAIYKNKMV